MSEKKPHQQPDKPVSDRPFRESVDIVKTPCKGDYGRDVFVSNTRPAPPNPHRDDDGKDKKT